MSSLAFEPAQKAALNWLRFTIEALHAMPVPQKKRQLRETFSHRLARLRRAAGLTQRELADKTGISNRMIAYYETRSGSPPIQVVQKLAPALGVSADQLLGLDAAPTAVDAPGTLELRLWKKVRQLRKLPERRRRAILEVLDGLLDQHDLDENS